MRMTSGSISERTDECVNPLPEGYSFVGLGGNLTPQAVRLALDTHTDLAMRRDCADRLPSRRDTNAMDTAMGRGESGPNDRVNVYTNNRITQNNGAYMHAHATAGITLRMHPATRPEGEAWFPPTSA